MGFLKIFDIIAGGIKIAIQWMTAYDKPASIAAREDADDKEKRDQFTTALATHDLDALRKKLDS